MLQTIPLAGATAPVPSLPSPALPQPAAGSGFADQIAALRGPQKTTRSSATPERSSPNANAKMVRSGMDVRDASAKAALAASANAANVVANPIKGGQMPSEPVRLAAVVAGDQPAAASVPLPVLPGRTAGSKDTADKPDDHRTRDTPGDTAGADPAALPAIPTVAEVMPDSRVPTPSQPTDHGREHDGGTDNRSGDASAPAAAPATQTAANGPDAAVRHDSKSDPAIAPGPDGTAPSVAAAAPAVPVPVASDPTPALRNAVEAPAASGQTFPSPNGPNAPAAGDEAATVDTVRRDDGGARISLSLHPAELGPIKVDLDRDADGRMSVVVTAHYAETLRGLIADQAHLHAALDAGTGASVDRQVSFRLEPDGGDLPGGGSFADGRGAPGPGGEGGRSGTGNQSAGDGSGRSNPGGFGDRTGSADQAPAVPTTGRMLRSALVNVIA